MISLHLAVLLEQLLPVLVFLLMVWTFLLPIAATLAGIMVSMELLAVLMVAEPTSSKISFASNFYSPSTPSSEWVLVIFFRGIKAEQNKEL